jgi:hypothetical protein
VQEVRLPDAGVPSTGAVSVGEVRVLLVSVSVVARPTNVSVLVGSVNAPVLLILEIIGEVSVLLVSVSVPAKVTKVPVVGNVMFVDPVLLLILNKLSESSVIELIVIEPAILSILQSHDTGG